LAAFFFTARFSPVKPGVVPSRFFSATGLTRVSPIFNRSKPVDDLRGVLAQPITCVVYVVVFSEYGGSVVNKNVLLYRTEILLLGMFACER